MVEKPESSCKFGNYLRARVREPSTKPRTVYEVRAACEANEPHTKREPSTRRALRTQEAPGAP